MRRGSGGRRGRGVERMADGQGDHVQQGIAGSHELAVHQRAVHVVTYYFADYTSRDLCEYSDGSVYWKDEEPTTLPDGVTVDMAHPVMVGFKDWAVKNNVSNDKFNDLLGQLATYEASQEVPMSTVLTQLGPQAQTRIGNVVTWAKANLDAAGFQLMRAATSDGSTAAATFAVLEQMISKTGQVRMPKPGDDNVPAGATGLAAIQAKQAAKNAKGERLYDKDPAYRKAVEAEYTAHFAANPVQRDRQGNIRG